MPKVETKPSKFLAASDVAKVLQISESGAYRVIRKMNEELKQQGYIIVPGRISKRYFEEKVYL